MTEYLRPEARPAGWKALDDNQKKALGKIVKLVAESITQLPKRNERRSDTDPEWISEDRASRTVFLSGARGTGKTTVLASLIQASSAGGMKDLDDEEDPDEVLKGLRMMRDHVVWLEPLDMEPLPESTNLLSTILARIEDAIWRRGVEAKLVASGMGLDLGGMAPRGFLEPDAAYSDAVLTLKRLQTDVALAWDGNVGQRGEHLDPDSYAGEVMRSEHARLSLSRRVEEALDALAYRVFNVSHERGALFVLPIDDLDLNPSACLKLLNLLRMVSVRRLFNVVLGDLRVAEMVLNLKLSSDLARVSGDITSVYQGMIAKAAADISVNALRKLVPPGQRIHLELMQTWESLDFRPLGFLESTDRLHDLLARCPMKLGRPFESGEPEGPSPLPVESLKDLLLTKGLTVLPPVEEKGSARAETREKSQAPSTQEPGSQDVKEAAYNGLDFLHAPPRQVTDIWYNLKSIVKELSPSESAPSERDLAKCLDRLLELLALHCQAVVAEEFPQEAREDVRQAFRKTPKGVWELGQLPLRVSAIAEPVSRSHPETTVSGARKKAGSATYQSRIRVSKARYWRFEVLSDRGTEPFRSDHREEALPWSRPQLPVGTASALMLFHDFLRLGDEGASGPSTLLPAGGVSAGWAVTEWSVGALPKAVLPWPEPPCSSFWEYDIFLRAWNLVLKELPSGSASDRETTLMVDRILFAWLSAGTAVVDRKAPEVLPPGSFESPSDTDWSKLVERLLLLCWKPESSEEYASPFEWLTSVALMLMPESGLDLKSVPVRALLKPTELVGFWNRQHEMIIHRRARRLAQLAEQDSPDLAEHFRTRPIKPFQQSLQPDKGLVFRQGHPEQLEPESSLASQVTALTTQSSNLVREIGSIRKEMLSIQGELRDSIEALREAIASQPKPRRRPATKKKPQGPASTEGS